ncbi:hypothetical protein KD050_18185 [Psychrobacillus sp. INOP01]|nr:hypothetical protein [Psychrobacillus sp. INOP01]QUG41192.1 hypothetical protein KD050_18185 [Psychrobacillus sp. INOP01]
MTKKSKPNFKKKEPNSRNDNREEFAEDLDLNQAKQKNAQQNNQKNR